MATWGFLLAPVHVVGKGIAAHGVALNPSRRGIVGQLVDYVTRLGVKPITGKPYKPTTQGKNERFHQTLFRFLDKQPFAATLGELQRQVDEFDRIYNTERPHQKLPGHVTPQQAWDAIPVADPPRPLTPASPSPSPVAAKGALLPENTRHVTASGGIKVQGVKFQIGSRLAGTLVTIVRDERTIAFYDVKTGELLIAHTWPEPGTRYVSNGKPRGPRKASAAGPYRSPDTSNVTYLLTQIGHRSPDTSQDREATRNQAQAESVTDLRHVRAVVRAASASAEVVVVHAHMGAKGPSANVVRSGQELNRPGLHSR